MLFTCALTRKALREGSWELGKRKVGRAGQIPLTLEVGDDAVDDAVALDESSLHHVLHLVRVLHHLPVPTLLHRCLLHPRRHRVGRLGDGGGWVLVGPAIEAAEQRDTSGCRSVTPPPPETMLVTPLSS